jgi:hypothetical protein
MLGNSSTERVRSMLRRTLALDSREARQRWRREDARDARARRAFGLRWVRRWAIDTRAGKSWEAEADSHAGVILTRKEDGDGRDVEPLLRVVEVDWERVERADKVGEGGTEGVGEEDWSFENVLLALHSPVFSSSTHPFSSSRLPGADDRPKPNPPSTLSSKQPTTIISSTPRASLTTSPCTPFPPRAETWGETTLHIVETAPGRIVARSRGELQM